MVKIQLFRGRRKEGTGGRRRIHSTLETQERTMANRLNLSISSNIVVNLDVLGNRVLNTHWVANPFIRDCMSVLKATDGCVGTGTSRTRRCIHVYSVSEDVQLLCVASVWSRAMRVQLWLAESTVQYSNTVVQNNRSDDW